MSYTKMEECYVCYEPCSTPAQCKCKTLYVHSSCITIMKLYGKKECGICKEPYGGTEYVTEEDLGSRLSSPPRYCFLIPTPLRWGNYLVDSSDIVMDPLRFVVLAIVFVLIRRAILNDWMEANYSSDILCAIIALLVLSCICSACRRKVMMTTRIVDQPPHHEPMEV